MLSSFMNDRVTLVKSNGQRIEGIRASVQPSKIFIDDGTLPLEEDDILERSLPNGMTERYVVLDRGFFAAFHGTPAHYQAKVQKTTAKPRVAAATNVYYLSGPNARVNVQSTDSSTNILNVNSAELFSQIVQAVQAGIASDVERAAILDRVHAIEASVASPGYLTAYQQLIAAAANHMTIIAPFLPALAQLAQK
jgi:hypothetical protein